MSFDDLGLRPELLRAVREQEYDTPTAVQVQAIPAVLEGRDLMAAAQTGSGKTAGFTLPMLQRLMDSQPAQPAGIRRVRALVLVPTRELCAQVNESVRTYGVHLPLRSVQIFGGVGMQPQVDALRAGVDIVIATPGRLLDHVERRTLDLRHVEILVLDEADRMLDMGFIHAIRRILSLLPSKRQNLLFSATFADEIRTLADKLLDSPRLIEVTPRNRPVDSIEQQIFQVDAARKTDLLAHLFQSRSWNQVLVFTRTKHGANRLAEKLTKAGISAEAIHGNKSQNARTRALENFKALKVRALVATDIAARGLDIDGLPQVVNFELPQVPEDYVHRIGRTGRAGADGCAVSLVARDEGQQWRAIERTIRRSIAPMPLPEFVALPVVALSVPDRGDDDRRAPQQRRSGSAPARRPADARGTGGGGASRGQGGGHRDGGRPAGSGRTRDAASPSGTGGRPAVGARPGGDRPATAPRSDAGRSERPPGAAADPGVRRTEGASTERKRYFNGQVVFNSASPSRGGRGR